MKPAPALTLLALGAVILSALLGASSPLGFLLLAFIISYIAFRKELLWRVRNRLLVTYILFGVVPIILIALGLTLAAMLSPLRGSWRGLGRPILATRSP